MYDPIALGARCELCPYKGKQVIPPTSARSGLVKLILVSDGPNRSEEKKGHHLAGRGGHFAKQYIRQGGISVDDTHITAAALCGGGSDKQNDRAADCCAPRLLRELAYLIPQSVDSPPPMLLMGKHAIKAVLGVKNILVARGFVWKVKPHTVKQVKAATRAARKIEDSTKRSNAELKVETNRWRRKLKGRVAIPTLAPSFVSRAETWVAIFKLDVLRVCRLALGKLKLDTVGKLEFGGLDVLSDLGPAISLDIETDGINPFECKILCVGMSDGMRTRILWPWKDDMAAGLSKFLRTRDKVIAHNLNFDATVLRAHGVY